MVDSSSNAPTNKNVVMIDEEKAEELKKLGNEEFQKKNYQKAIEYYSEAIEQSRNEGILTNRAASYI